MMMITVFIHSRGTECDRYRWGDCVYICDITAVILVILQLAANSELQQKVLDLVLTKKVLFTRLLASESHL